MSELTSAPVAPLRADDHVRGPAGAPLVIVFSEFTCPHCALAADRLARAPVRVAFRHFALRAKGPRGLALAHAAEAAALQGAFWPFHDALFSDQGRQDDPHLWARVQRLGLDLDRFEADRRSDTVAQRVRSDVLEGLRAGVATTPTLVVDGKLRPGVPEAGG